MNHVRLHTLILALSLVLLAAAPHASAQTGSEDPVAPCPPVTEMGVVPYSVCMTKWSACVAWRLLWGPTAPCLI